MSIMTIDRAIALTGDLPDYTYAAAWGLLAALGVLAFCCSSLRAMVVGEGRGPVDTIVRIGALVVCLSLYHTIVHALVGASNGLVELFAGRADWMQFLQAMTREFTALTESSDENYAERFLGFLTGHFLAQVFSITYFFVFVVFCLMSYLAAMAVALLNVLGPLLVVGGAITELKTTGAWFRSMVQVLLWPVVPPFLLVMIVNPSTAAIGLVDNTAFVMAQNLILGFLALFTPLLVAFILGKGGVTAFGTAMVLMAAKGGMVLAKAGAGMVGGGSGVSGGALSAGGGGEAVASFGRGLGPAPAPVQRTERPDDHCRMVWVSGRGNPEPHGMQTWARVGGAVTNPGLLHAPRHTVTAGQAPGPPAGANRRAPTVDLGPRPGSRSDRGRTPSTL